MGINKLLSEKREDILRITAWHGVRNIRVSGSAARQEADERSDVDLLIEVVGPTTPWFRGGLVADLEHLLQRRVDVVEADALREPLREAVLRKAVPL